MCRKKESKIGPTTRLISLLYCLLALTWLWGYILKYSNPTTAPPPPLLKGKCATPCCSSPTHSLISSHPYQSVPSGTSAHCSLLFTFTALLNDNTSVELPRTQPVSYFNTAFVFNLILNVFYLFLREWELKGRRRKKLALAWDSFA